MQQSDESGLIGLLDYVRAQRGIDFGAYKEASLKRRLAKRMEAVGAATYAGYLDYLQGSADEFTRLLDTLFVNVTRFFRDSEPWDVIRKVVIPGLLEAKSERDPIRVWCAGVASGEEPYSICMLLAEALGDPGFYDRARIYATDLDEHVLAHARQGIYEEDQLADVPEAMRTRYFEKSGGGAYTFRSDLRRGMIFGRHNLLEDAPISRLDLLICRNTLMYFNRDAQSRVLARFHFALRNHGYLFLGTSEMLLTRRNLFRPIDHRSRVFQKVPQYSLGEPMRVIGESRAEESSEPVSLRSQLRDLAFDASPVAQIVVSRSGEVVMLNRAARAQFGLRRRDEGRALHELEISYRPVDLRTLLDRVFAERNAVAVQGVEKRIENARTLVYDVNLTPITDMAGSLVAASIVFVDVTQDQQLKVELEHSRRDLEAAYEELQSTNEELETTNEELQSTNEELETMNEELQSTNEELGAVNDELSERTEAVTRLNAYMRSILNSTRLGVIVVNKDLRIHLWNDRATELWGLRAGEVEDRPIHNVDIGLPLAELKDGMRACLRGEAEPEPLVLAAHNRRGELMNCRVTCAPLLGPDQNVNGVILLTEEWPDDGAGPEGAA